MFRKSFSGSVRPRRYETLEARRCLATDDLAELNANQWGTFASDFATTSIVDDQARKFSGHASLLFQTASGFDTGVTYPKAGNANWNLADKDYLTFLQFPLNNNSFGFQGDQPVVVLSGDGGSFRYTPINQLTFTGSWQKIVLDLDGQGAWHRETIGTPSLSNIDQLEIHYDTWDFGFSVGIDAVRFGSFSQLSKVTPPPGVVPTAVSSKALVYVFDPIMENLGGKRMHEAFGWQDPADLTQQVIADLKASSHGQVQYTIAETVVSDVHPYYNDGSQHTDESFTDAWNRREFPQSGFDYERFLTENGIAARVDSGEIDEVWLWAGPLGGMWESAMAGDGAYWINGPMQAGGGSRAFPIMGWNFERGVGEAIHSYGHRSESSVAHAYRNWQASGDSTWEKFTTIDKEAPGNGGVGNVHFPVNGQQDYDYFNPRTVQSTALDWRNYPALTGTKTAVNNLTWSPNNIDAQREYLNWWYSLMPNVSGLGFDGYLANWWRYIADVDSFKQRDGQLAGASGVVAIRLSAPSSNVLAPEKQIFTAEALSDGAVGRVDFYVDGAFAYSDSLSPYVFEWDASGQLGTHTIVAKAYDLAFDWEFPSTPVQVTIAGSEWTNPVLAQDVDANAVVTAFDALLIINELNTLGARQLPNIRPALTPFLDPSGDGFVTARDALIVINQLNQQVGGQGSEGEGEPQSQLSQAQLSPFLARPTAIHSDQALSQLVDEWEQAGTKPALTSAPLWPARFQSTHKKIGDKELWWLNEGE